MAAQLMSSSLLQACPALRHQRAFGAPAARRAPAGRLVRMEAGGDPTFAKGSTKKQDSYQRIEEPVRGQSIPDGGPPVSQRQDDNDRLLVDLDGPQEQDLLKTEVPFPDAMRFKGAAPEVINSRLAMLGMLTASAANLASGKGIVEQFQIAPVPIAATFLTIIVASLVPILKGIPRSPKADGLPIKGSAFWSPDAEIINGRVAMVAFAILTLSDLWKHYH